MKLCKYPVLAITLIVILLQSILTKSLCADWPRFRGPNGSGVAVGGESIPVRWSKTENLAWKVPLPGPGASSPIIVGRAAYVTCYSGYGLDRKKPGEIQNLKRNLVCVDLKTGKLRWAREIQARMPEDPYDRSGVSSHGYASHTVVSDGIHVFCFFGKGGVYAFDLEGRELWNTAVGTGSDPPVWGSSSSPILFEDYLIVTAAAESQAIIAYEKTTGREVWRYQSTGLDGMWGTPALQSRSDNQVDLVMMVAGELWSLDPVQGKLRWKMPATESRQAYTNVQVVGARLFGSSGQNGGSFAVELDDVSEDQLPLRLWENNVAATYASPVVNEGRIYLVSRGILTVMDAHDGSVLKKQRLEGSRETGNRRFGSLDYASPVIANGKLYWLNASGQTFVFDVDDEIRQVAVNDLGSPQEVFWGTPAVARGRMILRSSKFLYCVKTDGEVDGPSERP